MARAAAGSLKRLVKVSPLWPLLRPRRFHAFCIGVPKSGTVSAWGMFSSRYRSGHEATRPEVVELMILRFEGRLTQHALMRRLRTRDRNLRLEMDSFSLLAMFGGELAAAFPQARFLLTVREPRSWLNSIINQHLNVDVSNRPADRQLRKWLYMPPGATYSRGEQELERRGLFPLAGYLTGWATHYGWVIDTIPRDRLLAIRTEELSDSIDELAGFLSIPRESIDGGRAHLHRTPHDHGVLSRLSPSLVDELVELHCQAVLEKVNGLVHSARRSQVRHAHAAAEEASRRP